MVIFGLTAKQDHRAVWISRDLGPDLGGGQSVGLSKCQFIVPDSC